MGDEEPVDVTPRICYSMDDSRYDLDLPEPKRRSLDEVAQFLISGGGEFQDFGKEIDWLPLTHRFTPGMYIREIFMPAGSFVVTKIHKTEHPFVISQGLVSVWKNGTVEHLQAPHTGITLPGTQRFLYVHEDTIWTTFHVTNLTDIEELERHLTDHPALALETPKKMEQLT